MVMGLVAKALLKRARENPDVCHDTAATGYGRQTEPIVTSRTGERRAAVRCVERPAAAAVRCELLPLSPLHHLLASPPTSTPCPPHPTTNCAQASRRRSS